MTFDEAATSARETMAKPPRALLKIHDMTGRVVLTVENTHDDKNKSVMLNRKDRRAFMSKARRGVA